MVDKQYVCLLKMLMVINSGLPEFVQMIAPHEEWSYLETGFKQVSLLGRQRFPESRLLRNFKYINDC